MRPLLHVTAAGLLLGSCFFLSADPAIGVVLTQSGVTVNHVFHSGNTPIYEGSLLETAKESVQVQFEAGARLRFAPDSRATLYADRLILEQGALEFRNRTYEVDANTLRISGASGQVTLKGSSVQVGALLEPLTVTNGSGVLVARLAPGQALELTPEQNAVTSALNGCLVRSGGAYLLTDQTSKITAELRGSPDLAHDVGRRIEASGTLLGTATPARNASQVIQVSAIKVEQQKCSARAAGAAGVAGAGGAAGGLSTTAVVAGVAVAAVGVAVPLGVLAAQSSQSQQNLSPVQ